jgi:hypothetical protein
MMLDAVLQRFVKHRLHIAANVKPTALRKSVRGPKERVMKRRIPPSIAAAHVSTTRLLAKGRHGTAS